MSTRIRRVVLQPEDGIFLELLLGLPSEAPDEGSIDELIASIPDLQEMIDDGVREAKKQMQEKGLTEYALMGRYGVPAIYKGVVTHIGDLEFLEPEQVGLITAWLPEQKTFAVWFGKEQWITFEDWTEEQFREKFDAFVIMPEEN